MWKRSRAMRTLAPYVSMRMCLSKAMHCSLPGFLDLIEEAWAVFSPIHSGTQLFSGTNPFSPSKKKGAHSFFPVTEPLREEQVWLSIPFFGWHPAHWIGSETKKERRRDDVTTLPRQAVFWHLARRPGSSVVSLETHF